MSLSLYMDHHVPNAISKELRKRGLDVLTAYEDNAHQLQDPELLDRATKLGRVLFTQDTDFLAEAKRRQQAGSYFLGILFGPQSLGIGTSIHFLELVAKAGVAGDLENKVAYIPF